MVLKSQTLLMRAEAQYALTCPAQGSPVPAFRLVLKAFYDFDLQTFQNPSEAPSPNSPLSLNCRPLRKRLVQEFHWHAQLKGHPSQSLGKAQDWMLIVFLFWIVEPIGSTKPKFSSILDSSSFKMVSGNALALTCPAQGSPVPGFR